jgi:hypothetical protein
MISWTEPTPDYIPIIQYQIVIQDSTKANYYEDTVECDGSSGTIIT